MPDKCIIVIEHLQSLTGFHSGADQEFIMPQKCSYYTYSLFGGLRPGKLLQIASHLVMEEATYEDTYHFDFLAA